MPLASDYTHHLAHLPATSEHESSPSLPSAASGEPTSLALQLQANNYAQNDIVHPFGAHHHHHQHQHQQMATPVAGEANHGGGGGGNARQVFLFPQEALRFAGHQQQPHQWPFNGATGSNHPSPSANDHLLAAAGSELNPFVPAAMMFNPAMFNVDGQNGASDGSDETTTAASAATTTTATDSEDNEHDEDSDQQPSNTLQSLLGGATSPSTPTKSSSQISNKKRSSDFFASAGQLLLSALPLLLVPSLGFMFSSSAAAAATSGSTGASGAARYHAPNPLRPADASSSSSSSGSNGYQSTGYLSDGYVTNASPAPQLFTPIPPTTTGSYGNYPPPQEGFFSRRRNVTSAPAMAQNASLPMAGGVAANSTAMATSTTTSTTVRPRPTPTVNPVMRLAASSIVGSISPSLGASYSPPSHGNSNKHLYKSPPPSTSHPSAAAAAGVRSNGSTLHTLVDEPVPQEYSSPVNVNNNTIARKPPTISTVIITTPHPNYNQTLPVVLSDDYFNATNNSVSIRQPTILLVTQDDNDELQRRGDPISVQVNRLNNDTMLSSSWSTGYGLVANGSSVSNRYDVPVVDADKAGSNKSQTHIGYEGVDFDAQYASLPTIRNNHGSVDAAIRFNAHRPPIQTMHPSISYLTTPVPALKHIRDKNRYQYVDVSDEYGVAASELNSSFTTTSNHRPNSNVDIYTLHASHKPVQTATATSHNESVPVDERLYPLSTWPTMRRRTISLVTASGNKTVLDSSSKYNNNNNNDGAANSSIIDDLTRELVGDGLHLWRAKHRFKRATSAFQATPTTTTTTTSTARPVQQRRRTLIRKVVRVKPRAKVMQLDALETGAKATFVAESSPVVQQRNRVKGPILSDRMDSDVDSETSGELSNRLGGGGGVDSMRQDDSRSKTSHLITAMIEHLDNDNENPDEQLINAARNNASDDWDMREQMLRKKMMLDKIATRSFASSSDKNSHRIMRDSNDSLEMGFGGRGRFPVDTSAAATGARQVNSNSSRSSNHRYPSSDFEDRQRINSLELNDETKRALAKFGKLFLEDTLKVEPNLRNSNASELAKSHHKSLMTQQVSSSGGHRLVKAEQDAHLSEPDYSPTRPSNNEGSAAATERYYSHSVTRAPELMHPAHHSEHTWPDSAGRYNASDADEYRLDPVPQARRRSLPTNSSLSDQYNWRASEERPPASYSQADRGGYSYNPQPPSESPINRYNSFLASTQPHSNGSSASSIPSRTLSEVDQDRQRYNSTRYTSEWGPQVNDSPRYEFGAYAGPQRATEQHQQQALPPAEPHYRPAPATHYRAPEPSDHYRPPPVQVYSQHPHESHQYTSPNDTHYYTHRAYPPTAESDYRYHTPAAASHQPTPPHQIHQSQGYIGDEQYRAERARPTYQPQYIEPLPVREPLPPPPPPPAHYVGGQYAASVPVRRPIMRPGAPVAQGGNEALNPYAQSAGLSASAPLLPSPFGSSARQDDGTVKDYLKRAQFSDSDRDKLMAR